jgi:DNA polymerase
MTSLPPFDTAAALELAGWYAEMGVTDALDDEPHDHFAENATAGHIVVGAVDVVLEPTPAAAGPTPSRPEGPLPTRGSPAPAPLSPRVGAAASVTPDAAAGEARQRAATADSLEALKASLATFEGCALKATAKSLCFADGNPQARVMLVGEAPGADEDRVGLPFVGRSGQLLDRMLAAIGLKRDTDVYIANIVPWRPPGNRTPTLQEVAICLPFIQRQIELADPDILVCVGGPSAQALLGFKGVLASRGRWTRYDTGTRAIRAIATLHPAYLLRHPIQKRLAWRDFRMLKAALAETAPKTGEPPAPEPGGAGT